MAIDNGANPTRPKAIAPKVVTTAQALGLPPSINYMFFISNFFMFSKFKLNNFFNVFTCFSAWLITSI
jgi:hypothetical protein